MALALDTLDLVLVDLHICDVLVFLSLGQGVVDQLVMVVDEVYVAQKLVHILLGTHHLLVDQDRAAEIYTCLQ